MSKKKIYITSSILLAAVVVPSIATFTYLNINVKPGVEITTNIDNNNVLAYESSVELHAKLTRISNEHDIEYKWYAQEGNNTQPVQLSEFDNKSTIEIKNDAIEKVKYFVEINDKDDEKQYKSEPIEINYKQPNLYINADADGKPFNPFKETISNSIQNIKLKANLKSENSNNSHAIEGWFIYKKDNKDVVYKIQELLDNQDPNFIFVNNKFTINPQDRELVISDIQTIKETLSKGYIFKYYWTNTDTQFFQDVELKFEA